MYFIGGALLVAAVTAILMMRPSTDTSSIKGIPVTE